MDNTQTDETNNDLIIDYNINKNILDLPLSYFLNQYICENWNSNEFEQEFAEKIKSFLEKNIEFYTKKINLEDICKNNIDIYFYNSKLNFFYEAHQDGLSSISSDEIFFNLKNKVPLECRNQFPQYWKSTIKSKIMNRDWTEYTPSDECIANTFTLFEQFVDNPLLFTYIIGATLLKKKIHEEEVCILCLGKNAKIITSFVQKLISYIYGNSKTWQKSLNFLKFTYSNCLTLDSNNLKIPLVISFTDSVSEKYYHDLEKHYISMGSTSIYMYNKYCSQFSTQFLQKKNHCYRIIHYRTDTFLPFFQHFLKLNNHSYSKTVLMHTKEIYQEVWDFVQYLKLPENFVSKDMIKSFINSQFEKHEETDFWKTKFKTKSLYDIFLSFCKDCISFGSCSESDKSFYESKENIILINEQNFTKEIRKIYGKTYKEWNMKKSSYDDINDELKELTSKLKRSDYEDNDNFITNSNDEEEDSSEISPKNFNVFFSFKYFEKLKQNTNNNESSFFKLKSNYLFRYSTQENMK